jgi:uncharacterized membrane protein YjjP (DUF1212 family)
MLGLIKLNLTKQQIGKIVELCLLVGETMLKSGAETTRIEDTMMRIAASFGMPESQCYVTQTGILFSANRDERVKLVRIAERSTDLEKVVIVNDISRKISMGEMNVDEALEELKIVAKKDLSYPFWIQVLAAATASGCFLIMFKGVWGDFLPAIIAGGVGHMLYIYLHKVIKVKFFAEGAAAFVIGLLAFLAIWTGWGAEMDKIIIASVMPLVPGLLITNAVRDLMDGHFVAALSKGADALLTSLSIGAGIATVVGFVL